MMDDDRPEVAERRPSVWFWHFHLFFRPRAFFRAFARERVPLLTALCAWLYGTASVIDRIETNSLRGRGNDAAWLGDWAAYWPAVLSMGVIGGLFYFAIGGWWYRQRIKWSGAPSPDTGLARRVYLFSSQIWALPTLSATILESTAFDTPLAALQAEGSAWYFLLLLFPFWSLVCSYLGVRTVFTVRRGTALAWFLVLPALVYAFVLAAAFLAAGLLDEPDLKNRRVYQGTAIEFSYPGNWAVEVEESEGDAESVRLEGAPDAFVRVVSYSSPHEAQEELDASLDGYRKIGVWTQGAELASWGPFEGVGTTGILVVDRKPCVLELFVVVDDGSERFLEVQTFFAQSEEDAVRPVLGLLRNTLRRK